MTACWTSGRAAPRHIVSDALHAVVRPAKPGDEDDQRHHVSATCIICACVPIVQEDDELAGL